MKTQSCKAKGRNLQKDIRDLILKYNPELTLNDVSSTSMGAGGEDVKLSEAALKFFPFAIECKSKKAVAVYPMYEQAISHAEKTDRVPALFIKQNRSRPLAVVDAEFFVNLVRAATTGNW